MNIKKTITWLSILFVIVGIFTTGGLFKFIDLIIVRPIVNILFILFNFIGDFGLSIIIFTILVKFLTWPLLKKQLHHAKLMRKLQPELAKIKKQCNGNRQLESLRVMDLYKRHNAKPFASIFIILIQFPIFIAIFSAIHVIANPLPHDNISSRAYNFVSYNGSIIQSIKEKQITYLQDLQNTELSPEEKSTYDFQPQLFGTINLEAKASDILTHRQSWSAVFILICAVLAALIQYFIARQQIPSHHSGKKKSFREIIKSASDGKEIEQSEINNIATGQMAKIMPIMMFFIVFNLHGALAFYYLLTNFITFIQQHFIFKNTREEMDNIADKAILKELKNIQEAEVITNKKTKTKITHISAKELKKKRK